MKNPASLLKVSHLTVAYNKNIVLWDICLQVAAGQMIALIGPNGAGKSTLLKALLGLVRPLSGEISFFDKPLAQMKQEIAYVPQRESVDWSFPMTLFELVLMGTYGRLGFFRTPGAKEKKLAHLMLEKVGLEKVAKRQIDELSGGQKQRAFLARALCQQAHITFMDEPFAGIDAASAEVILEVLKELKCEGKTLFVVHHDLETVARSFDSAILINTHLISAGSIAEVLTEQNIARAYGKSAFLLDRVTKLAQEKREGRLS